MRRRHETPGISPAGRVRAYLAGAIVTLGIFGVATRAYSLQIDEGAKFAEQAARQHARTVDIPGPRGEIVDAHGQPLAVSADTDSIWANPREIKDVTETAAKLAPILDKDPNVLENKLGADRRFVWLERHVTPDLAKRVRDAKLPGIEVAREPRRWYPGRALAGPIVGRADIDGKGLDGIELAMNDLLSGKRGAMKALRDARGRRMLADGVSKPESGATVQLTLDRSIQSIAETALYESVTKHEAKNGVVVVLDVQTSKVLAMATYPVSDPNDDKPPARDRPVTDAYEAGSVMKIFSVASALDEGVVTPDTEFDLRALQIGPKAITDVHYIPYGTVTDIIKKSSNIGASKIALRLGRDKLSEHLARFGFGIKTGIELPGEVGGTMRAGNTWRDIELATISYGYGLTVTPVQIAAALAAIGNGGMYHPPRIVDQAIDADGTVLYASAVEERRVISEKTAEQMRKILGAVFDKDLANKGLHAGTAAAIAVPGFACGGKTGTAHKWDAKEKKYAPDRYLSSFAGLAPIADPKLAIVVLVDEPSGGDYFGGKVAGPVFGTVASETLRYLGVPGVAEPVPPPPTNAAKKPVVVAAPPPALPKGEFIGMGYTRALTRARELRLAVTVEGSGCVVEETRVDGGVKLRFGSDCRDR